MSTFPETLGCPSCAAPLATRECERNVIVDVSRWDAFFEVFSATPDFESDVYVVEAPCPECGAQVTWRSPGFSFRKELHSAWG